MGKRTATVKPFKSTAPAISRRTLQSFPRDIIPLVLVRVYGVVTGEREKRSVIKADYVRVWHWFRFNFMDFGEDHSNPEWKKRQNLPPDALIYDLMSQDYYNQHRKKNKAKLSKPKVQTETKKKSPKKTAPPKQQRHQAILGDHPLRTCAANFPGAGCLAFPATQLLPSAYASSSSSSSVVRPVMSGSSLSMAASIAARFFSCSRRIFSSTVSRVISL